MTTASVIATSPRSESQDSSELSWISCYTKQRISSDSQLSDERINPSHAAGQSVDYFKSILKGHQQRRKNKLWIRDIWRNAKQIQLYILLSTKRWSANDYTRMKHPCMSSEHVTNWHMLMTLYKIRQNLRSEMIKSDLGQAILNDPEGKTFLTSIRFHPYHSL